MTEISEIINELLSMICTMKQLDKVETYKDADYSEVIVDLKWSHQQCKHRLATLTGAK
jgi:hypothetical protein